MNVEVRNESEEKDKFASVLTVEEVLTTKGFEHLTKEEAEEYIQTLVQFCVIAYMTYSKLEAKGEIQVETNNNLAA